MLYWKSLSLYTQVYGGGAGSRGAPLSTNLNPDPTEGSPFELQVGRDQSLNW